MARAPDPARQMTSMLNLRDIAGATQLFGSQHGKQAFTTLLQASEGSDRLAVSIDGVECVDVTFARESVVALARRFRGQKSVCLVDVPAKGVSSNWAYAAKMANQPLTAWSGAAGEIVGPDISGCAQRLVDYILDRREVFAVQAAKDFHISLASASVRLKKLADAGYFLRDQVIAPSGGIEYRYNAIRPGS